jgi:hypothetical protein
MGDAEHCHALFGQIDHDIQYFFDTRYVSKKRLTVNKFFRLVRLRHHSELLMYREISCNKNVCARVDNIETG